MISNLRPGHRTGDILTLPSHLPIPGAGLLPVNTYVIKAREPILVDTGLAHDRGPLLDAIRGAVDPADLRWIVLTHDDRDHAGNLRDVLIAAPRATIVTNGLSLARLGEEWDVPAHRALRVNAGTTLNLGGRLLSLLRPPAYDAPSTLAVFDHDSRSLFAADSFGSVVAEPIDDAADAAEADYLAGMTLFTHANAPWTAIADSRRFGSLLDSLAALDAAHLYSSHAPAVHGRVATAIQHMHTIPELPAWLPDADPIPAALASHDAIAETI
jgi:glyoxylase-like metal-dependent hydrolase (beta-lactamase superfamily II)